MQLRGVKLISVIKHAKKVALNLQKYKFRKKHADIFLYEVVVSMAVKLVDNIMMQ